MVPMIQVALLILGWVLVGLTLLWVLAVLIKTPALMHRRVRRETFLALALASPASFFVGAGLVLLAPLDLKLTVGAVASLAFGTVFAAMAVREISR